MAKRKALFSIQKPRVTWTGAWSPLFEPDPDDPDDVPPSLVVWLDPEGVLAAFHLVEAEDVAGELARTFKEAVAASGEARPVRLRMEDPELVSALAPHLDGITVAVGATPNAAEAWEAMADEFISRWEALPEPSLLAGEGVTPEVVEALFAALAAAHEADTWASVLDGPLQVDLPELGRSGLILVLPEGSEERSLVLLDDLAAFVAFAAEDEDEAPAGDPAETPPKPMAARAVGLYPATDLQPEARQEILRHGWPVAAPDAHPMVVCTDAEGLPRQPNREDLLLLAAAVQASLRAQESVDEEGLLPADEEDFRAEFTLAVAGREVAGVVRFPPEGLEAWVNETMLEDEDAEEGDEAEAEG